MRLFTRDAVGLSRYLSWPGAVSLGAGLGLAVELTLRPSLGHAGPAAYGMAFLLYLPLLAAWLDLPGEHGPFSAARYEDEPRWGLWIAWLELGGLWVLAALLTQGAARALPFLVNSFFGLELRSAVFLPVVVGLVTVNELIGTRAQSRISTALVAVTALLWVGLFVSVVFAWNTEPASTPPRPAFASDTHELYPVALIGAILWGPQLLISRRRVVRDPSHRGSIATGILWSILPALGALGLWLSTRYPDVVAGLEGIPMADASGSATARTALAGLGAALCVLGISQVTASAIRLWSTMSWEGMFPRGWVRRRSERGVPVWPLLATMAIAWGLARVADTESLVAGAALAILWGSAVSLWPHVRASASKDKKAGFRLPFHPFIPAMVVAGCLFLSLVLPGHVLLAGLIWSATAGVYYLLVGRELITRREQKKKVLGDVPTDDGEDCPRVMVAVREGPTFSTLVQVGACLAARRGGELVVLKVEPLVEQVPWAASRQTAEKTLERLTENLEVIELPEDLGVRPLVRVAPTVADGILSAAAELNVEFLVVGWPRNDEESESDPVVEKVFAATHRAMAVVHGILPNKLGRALVASAGGPHASVALELAEALGTVSTSMGSGEDAASVTGSSPVALLNVITPQAAVEAEGEEAIRQTRERRGESDVEIGEVTVEAGSPVDGIRREVGLQDILFLGASVDRLLGQTRLGGLATELASGRPGVTVVVKRSEKAPRFWGRRLWEQLSRPLPPLTDERRAEVQVNMRRAARADVDFYILISLSAAIASLGLMQSSAAVVIGAMLVAPLMSPILAMGHCIVRGHLRLLRRAASSTVKGVGIAIGVGAIFPLIFPGIPLTPEILARGAPSLLDLAVALASGAAAAYAVARPSVAAALPGVAIAAALVPPLCVAGIGLGASELAIAGGALLLFTTNLCAIVLAAALIFLMLGFRPRRSHQDEWVWRSLALASLGLLMISVPLGMQTRDLLGSGRSGLVAGLEREILGIENPDFRVERVRFETDQEGVMVALVDVRTFGDGVSLEALDDLRRRLTEQTGQELRFEAFVSRVERRLLPEPPEEDKDEGS